MDVPQSSSGDSADAPTESAESSSGGIGGSTGSSREATGSGSLPATPSSGRTVVVVTIGFSLPRSTDGLGTTTNSFCDGSVSTTGPSSRTGGGATGTARGAKEAAPARTIRPTSPVMTKRSRLDTGYEARGRQPDLRPGVVPWVVIQEPAELSAESAETADAAD